ncbi:hypothetical protein RHS04_04732 [Rhizoctonia solani]|uniref:Uncharacterized protein n=1 Tax=Rhizoctonia solani TaxID=456999 RepID=A0A8H7H9L5_9AGAM|nr:hypothetical protein RHS04_04732 [Rhizoctonia solani]
MFPTRVQLESLKRAALQAKCKELGIKANSRSEVLIDMVLERYFSTAGPSKPSTSTASSSKKRKADDEPKARRVRAKAEPQDEVLPTRTSPRRGKRAEVVIRTPARVTRAMGKGKAKETTPVEDVVEVAKTASRAAAPATPAPVPTRPLVPTSTSATVIDTAADVPAQSQIDTNDTRLADLELQIRNARKAGDDSARDVSALKAFQNAIQQAFGDSSSSDTLDSMGQLAKLRDIAPQLLAASRLDPDVLYSRVESVEKQAADIGESLKNNQVRIAEMKQRVQQLEERKAAVTELEAMVRHLQSEFNRIPESVFNNGRPEDSVVDSRYTIIRAPSAGPSGSQPSSLLSIPEGGFFPSQNQNQNSGRASSVAKSSRGSRPPLAEKEREIEETGSRRSLRPLSQSPSRTSSQSSRRSPKPYSRPGSVEPPSPTRGKGKGRMIKTSLETVAEDETPLTPVADPFTPTSELPRSPPTPTRKSVTPPVFARKSSSPRGLARKSASPPVRKSATPPSRKSVSPPSSETKPSSSTSFFPSLPTFGANGPIKALPFALVASTVKPSSEAASRPSAPSGRVGRTINRPHTASARRPMTSTTKDKESQPKEPQSFFNFAPSGLSTTTTTTNGPTNTSSAPANGGHGFITPERLGANFSMFPAPKIDLGRTPGGLAFKTTGRAPPGTPAATNTLYGTEVARDTRFADLAYDLDVSGSVSWEDSHPIWAAGIPHNAANP